jgi:hypothetical protein
MERVWRLELSEEGGVERTKNQDYCSSREGMRKRKQ